MKWTNPGHQLDKLGERYLKVKNLYIYGIDDTAKKAFDFLQWLGIADEFNITFVTDINNFNKMSHHSYFGKRVIAFQTELCAELQSSSSEENVVALSWVGLSAEREILEQIGIDNIFYLIQSHNRRDNFVQNFICVWLMYKHGKLLSHWTNFLPTLKCNLNCNYCLNFYELLTNPENISFTDFKEHIDVLFSKFDYLYSLHFTGGEPLLVKELPKFIQYIEKNYKDRVFEFFVITNTTIIPNEEVISAVKSLNGHFLLDDYSASIKHSKIEEIKNRLKQNNINYIINKPQNWFDLDIDNTNNSNLSDQELEDYKDNCNSFLHEFGEKRIYACCYQQYAYRAGIGTSTSNDFIEIANTSKMEILEFRQGFTHKGYVDFCKHCRGIGNNAKIVPAAVQITRTPKNRKQVQPIQDIDMKGKVSICVPIYNTDKYLSRCINSLLGQSYQNLEIILVNDGSTDSCGTICATYAQMDSRIVVINKENGGEASARNVGLCAAKGEYIMFIDSDDEYLPNAVDLLITAANENQSDLVIGGYLEKRGQIEHFGTGHLRHYSAKEAALGYLYPDGDYGFTYIISSVNAKLFRKKIISTNNLLFDERFVVGNDMVYICEYLKHTKSIYDIFTPIYVYYKFHPSERVQGMSWNYPDASLFFAYVADKMIKIAQLDELEFKKIVSKQYKDLLYGLVNTTANKKFLTNGLMPYFTSFCNEIDLLQIGAMLDLSENCIKKEEGDLPIRLLSYYIVNKRFSELNEMLLALSQTRKVIPFKDEHVRQMILLGHETYRNQSESSVTEMELEKDLHLPEKFSYLDDKLLVDQVTELVTTLVGNMHQIDSYEAKIRDYEHQINSYIHSTSWRVTKPFRFIMGLLKNLRVR